MHASQNPMIAAVLALAAVAAGAASAEDKAAAQQRLVGVPAATLRVDAQVMSGYKRGSWERYLAPRAGGAQSAGDDLPPTDCPPAPAQECVDSWKIKLINPFDNDHHTVNPFE